LLTSSSVLLIEEQEGDCGVDWHWSATLKDIRARTPRGGPTTLKSTNIQRVWSCDQSRSFNYASFGTRPLSALSHRIMLSALGTLRNPPASKAFFSPRPAYLPLKQPAASENISLRALLESHCPSVLSSFRPAWWLFKRVDVQFVLPVLPRTNANIVDTYRPYMAF
jgi:hypothetical protein